MRTAACYVRVSTDDQLEYSPDSQLKIILDYAKSHELLLPEDFIFREDDGISGRKAEKRPEFQRMIAAARQKPTPFEVILVWKFSRFARNQEESIVYKSLLRREGIEVVSVSEPLADGPFGGLIERIIEWMDEYYSVNLSGEVKRGMKERLSRGLPTSGAPYGYCYQDGCYQVVPQEAELVQQLFARYAAGEPLRTLAGWANTLGTGRLWENRTVEYILRNPVYIGKLRSGTSHNGGRDYYGEQVEVVDGQHQPIIGKELWEAVQQRIAEQKARYRRHDHTANAAPRLYNGLLRCSACGATLASGGKTDSWQCTRYAHGTCKVSHYTTTDVVSAAVLPGLAATFESGAFLSHLHLTSKEDDAGSKLAKKQLEQAKARMRRAREAYEAGAYTLEEFQDSKARIEADIHKLEASLAPKEEWSPEEIRRRFLDKNKKNLEILLDPQATDAERNNAAKQFIEKIVFYRAENKFDIFYWL